MRIRASKEWGIATGSLVGVHLRDTERDLIEHFARAGRPFAGQARSGVDPFALKLLK